MTGTGREIWIQRYYLLTPLFILADLMFGITFRVSGLGVATHRFYYYGLCILCALFIHFKPRAAPLVIMGESSINLLVLLAGVFLPVVYLGNLDAGVVQAGITADNLLNFILTGGILLAVFYSAQRQLHRAATRNNGSHR